jgi:DNA-binding LytR/AlgR family response regulator
MKIIPNPSTIRTTPRVAEGDNMKIPTIKLSTNRIELIDTSDVLYLTTHEHKITFHCFNGMYRPLDSLHDYARLLSREGFDQLDKSNLVQITKVTRFDKRSRVALFDLKGIETLSCYVSRRNVSKLKHIDNHSHPLNG